MDHDIGFSFTDLLAQKWVIDPKDPLAWTNLRLPNRYLWSKQREIMESVRDNPRTAVRSCHGVGKSFIAATIASWWASAFPEDEALVVSTAPTGAQVGAILWEEIRRAHREGNLPGRVGGDNVWKSDNNVILGMGRKPADHAEHAFQGLHKRRVLVVIDEACGIPLQLWTAFEAVATGSMCRQLAIGNPDDPGTEFANICKPGSGWNVIEISAFDSPNLTGEDVPEEMRDVLVSREWVEDKKKRWGEESPRYQSKVLGRFPELGTDTLITPTWIERAQNADLSRTSGRTIVSVDVARYGSDQTIIGVAQGPVFRVKTTLPMSSTTETCGRTVSVMKEYGSCDVVVDGNGVGGGVVDSLRENVHTGVFTRRQPKIVDFQAGGRARNPEKFANARSEAWWTLREMFEDGDIDIDEKDDELAAQLGSVKYSFNSRGQIQVESKGDMKKRGLPSPDRADCLMQTAHKAGNGVPVAMNATALGKSVVPAGW